MMRPGLLQKTLRFGAMLALAVTLAACGTDRPKPTELGANPARIGVRTAWTARIDGDVKFALGVRVVGNNVYLASTEGLVAAIDARTGGDVWRANLKTKLTAGVGSDGRYASVVNADNELITLDAGKVIWRQQMGALTLTAPLVAGERVFVLSADRTVTAFDAASGRKLWMQPRTGDALVLGQAGLLMAMGDTLVVGQSGKVVGMNPQNGSVRWESGIANSRGTNEVERLVDIVAGVSREGDSLCLRSFQSAVGCVDTLRGRTVWTKTSNGAVGISGDASTVVGTEADGKVVAWKRSEGDKLWTSENLRYRGLSAPLWLGKSIVIGDESGLVHFVSPADGSLLNRVNTDGSALAAAPVLAGSTLVVVTRRGGVFGFRPD